MMRFFLLRQATWGQVAPQNLICKVLLEGHLAH